MQRIFVPKENIECENRVAVTPIIAKKLILLGFKVCVEHDAGSLSEFQDVEYKSVGAEIAIDRENELKLADIVLGIKRLPDSDIQILKKDAIHISLLDVFNDKSALDLFRLRGVKAISLEMMPRISVAQKMDVLSSQSNLAGYSAVLQAAAHIKRVFPMMITAAGTISPVKVFIIGVGVAGLQAIATAKRLGAVVEAFDTRPEVAEQVKSLGAKFLKIDLGDIGKTDNGYAKELTSEQIIKQKEGMLNACKRADIVITTAKVFGRKAPILIDKNMLDFIDTSTLIVDIATAVGGNVEGSVANKIVKINDYIEIFGMNEPEQYVATDASNMFAENIYNFVEHFRGEYGLILDQNDEILTKCLIK